MTNLKISKIDLNSEEQTLLEQISFTDNDHETLRTSCQAAGKLSEKLIKRKAIPKIRMEYFTNPKYNTGVNESRKQTFERKGNTEKDILYHGHFLKYLKYFIFGPDLPSPLIDEFCTKINEDDLPAIAQRLVRKYDLNPQNASEEFYKLCLECNQEWESYSVKKSVNNIR